MEKKVLVKCSNCQKQITIQSNKLLHYKNHFCSLTCRYQYQVGKHFKKSVPAWNKKEWISMNCASCGVLIKRPPARARAYKHHYCSWECRNKAKRQPLSEERRQILKLLWQNPNYRHRMILAHKGKPSPRKGMRASIEQIAKMKAYNNKPEVKESQRQRRMKQVFPFKDTSIEMMIQNKLKENHLLFETHKPIRVGSGFHQVDIFIKPNICIEIDGTRFHADPRKYQPHDVIWKDKQITAADIWRKDAELSVTLELMGYKVIRLWEIDIRKSLDYCLTKVLSTITIPLEAKHV